MGTACFPGHKADRWQGFWGWAAGGRARRGPPGTGDGGATDGGREGRGRAVGGPASLLVLGTRRQCSAGPWAETKARKEKPGARPQVGTIRVAYKTVYSFRHPSGHGEHRMVARTLSHWISKSIPRPRRDETLRDLSETPS